MPIGDKVAEAKFAKREQELNEQGQLSGRQLAVLAARGLPISDARTLAAEGMLFAELLDLVSAQAQVAQSNTEQALTQQQTFMEKVLEKARNRRPESYNGDFPEPLTSHLNPKGVPWPRLRCTMWEGIWVQKTKKAQDGYPLEDGQLSVLEVRLLNALPTGLFTIENRDGEPGVTRVLIDRDPATEKPLKLVIAYPEHWLSKDGKHKKPSVTDVCRQICHIEGPVEAWLDQREAQGAAA